MANFRIWSSKIKDGKIEDLKGTFSDQNVSILTIHILGIHPSLRMWRMSLANQRNERPHLSNGPPESKPVDCSSQCRNLNCSLQLQRDCCSLQSGCCRQATISPITVYSAGAPGLPNNVSLAGVCSRVHPTSEEAPEAEWGQPWHWRPFWQSDWEQRCRGRAISRHR